MPPYQPPTTGRRTIGVIIVLVSILVAALGVWWWLGNESKKPAPTTETSAPALKLKSEIKTQAPLAVEDLNTLSKTQTLMDKRKAQLGLETGVDMIVRSDEIIQIGDTRIPMSEILEKIRLKEGGIIENELTGTPTSGRELTSETARKRYHQIGQRVAEIEKFIADPKTQDNPALLDSLRQEQESLQQTAENIRNYLENETRLQAVEDQIAAGGDVDLTRLKETRDTLRQTQSDLAQVIKSDPYWDHDVDAYGIYIVRTGDNIWNIHFRFLRNYFTRKGILLEPTSDEPTDRGASSGVGKILKFSENMVNIYNIRNRRLELNLDMIHPLSKVVIFNLERVFSLLKQIDHQNVQRVEFDGETLWVPADR